jgi:hypothetical protein
VDLDVGPPGTIVDRDVEIVVAISSMVRPSCRPATEPVSAPSGDPAQLLHVDVDELTGTLTFISDRDGGGSIEGREPRESLSSEHRVDRRARMTELIAEPVWTELRPTARAHDPFHLVARQRVWGHRWGADDRSASPADPSSWNRRIHL